GPPPARAPPPPPPHRGPSPGDTPASRGPPRPALAEIGKIDPVTEDLLIGQLRSLEQFQWFVRAHLESSGGTLANATAQTERQAARLAERSGEKQQ
ncbi:hypothetical protein ACFW9X_20105, partial [Streptomyces sp. NPDC059466]